MRQRTLVVVATALVTFGLTAGLTAGAPASSKPRAERAAPAPATLEGQVVDWDPAASSLTIGAPDVIAGSRRVRRMLRPLDEVPLVIVPRTRIMAEDEEGARGRIDAEGLFAELDESDEILSVRVSASVVRRAPRRGAAATGVTAKRIVLYLPAHADDGDDADEDPGLDDGEPGPGDPPSGDDPPEEPTA